MNIIIHGSTGAMGKLLASRINAAENMDIAAFVSPEEVENPSERKFTQLADFTGSADIVIDFSHHSAVGTLLDYCKARALPVVIATTGHTSEEKELIFAAAKTIPVFFAANMSIGVALIAKLAREAAAMFPNADIEIIERHHNRKLDVPSGTALMLANAICEVRPGSELVIGRHEEGKRKVADIGIHSIRLGNEVGTHEIIISTGSETVTIKHEAEDRSLFADGAVAAASYLLGKSAGLYSMGNMLA